MRHRRHQPAPAALLRSGAPRHHCRRLVQQMSAQVQPQASCPQLQVLSQAAQPTAPTPTLRTPTLPMLSLLMMPAPVPAPPPPPTTTMTRVRLAPKQVLQQPLQRRCRPVRSPEAQGVPEDKATQGPGRSVVGGSIGQSDGQLNKLVEQSRDYSEQSRKAGATHRCVTSVRDRSRARGGGGAPG